MMAIGLVLATIWLCGFIAYACLDMLSGGSNLKTLVVGAFWPVMLMADVIADWAYPDEEDRK